MARQRKVSTSRVIAADRQTIFDVIADPAMHPVIDGSGTVGGMQDGGPTRLELGAHFGMDMKMGTSYRILNEVVEFEEGRLVAWRHFHGHRWRYELRDVAGGTEVTETFDWSTAKAKLPLELAGFPKRNLAGMRQTLERLDRYVTTGSVEHPDAA
jgi:uncharacterized protein YndB with AHSA1/START domain